MVGKNRLEKIIQNIKGKKHMTLNKNKETINQRPINNQLVMLRKKTTSLTQIEYSK